MHSFLNKLAGVFFLGLCLQPVIGQNLFTYGTKPVTPQSFLKAFNKNPGEGDRKKAMEEYLPLYINYTLKVQDAYDSRLDTLPGQKTELLEYKKQLAENFMAEKAGSDAVAKEAIERLRQDVLLGHIYIGYGNDTAGAMAKAQQCVTQLKAGKSWGDAAIQYSTDEDLKQSKGIAGWITAFSIPYDYENLVYALPKGGYTQPVKASGGIHIFSKRDVRQGSGYIQVAQILLVEMPGMTDAEILQRSRLADSLYGLLQKGADMNILVMNYSQDRTSNQMGGVLPPFGISTYEPAFETAAFALQNPGEVTPPVKTSMGWHILKLVKRFPLPTADDPGTLNELRQKALADGRLEKAKDVYIRKQLPAIRYKPSAITQKQLQQYTDSLLKGGNTATAGIAENAVIFTFDKQKYTVGDWVAYARVQSMAGTLKPGEPIQKSFDDFVTSRAADYLPAHLDEVDKEFAAQFREFKDANLLFEAMERNVWSKAMDDTAALKNYYTANPGRYVWDENILAILVNGSDSTFTRFVYDALSDDPTIWRELNEKYGGALYADSARYEISVLSWAKDQPLTPGKCTPLFKSEVDGTFSFAYVIEKGKAGVPRSFEEARGFVVTDVQQKIEEDWIARLKKKYPVKVNDVEWKKLLASAK